MKCAEVNRTNCISSWCFLYNSEYQFLFLLLANVLNWKEQRDKSRRESAGQFSLWPLEGKTDPTHFALVICTVRSSGRVFSNLFLMKALQALISHYTKKEENACL